MKIRAVTVQLLYSTIRIETNTGAGTGFIFSYDVGNERYHFVVTNKHVVAGAQRGTFFFAHSDGENPIPGERMDVSFDNFESAWLAHPNEHIDVTLLSLGPLLQDLQRHGRQVYFKAISHTLMPSPEQLDDMDAVEEVLFIGYPNGLYDAVNLMPIARRGTTATHPYLDYECGRIF